MPPPFSHKRLSLTGDGKVRLKPRKPYYTGQTEVLFEPLDFLRRLVAIVPPPRQHQVRFHGVFAPHSKHRAQVKQMVPRPKQAARPVGTRQPSSPVREGQPKHRTYRLLWAELLRRTFQQDVLCCPRCNDRLKLLALIKDPVAIRRICAHLGLPTELAPPAGPRAPPQLELDDWPA